MTHKSILQPSDVLNALEASALMLYVQHSELQMNAGSCLALLSYIVHVKSSTSVFLTKTFNNTQIPTESVDVSNHAIGFLILAVSNSLLIWLGEPLSL